MFSATNNRTGRVYSSAAVASLALDRLADVCVCSVCVCVYKCDEIEVKERTLAHDVSIGRMVSNVTGSYSMLLVFLIFHHTIQKLV